MAEDQGSGQIPDKEDFYDCVDRINPENSKTKRVFIYFELKESYGEIHRQFHTFDHIKRGLKLFEGVRDLCDNYSLVQFAWWHHDCIYIPGYKHNVSASAERAYFNALQLGFSEEEGSKISSLVMATDHINGVVSCRDQEVIHDIDLVVLGSEPDEYVKYSKQIREEYLVYRETYNRVRLSVLQDILDSDFIYYLGYFRDRYAKGARENISREIEDLIGS